MRERKRESKKEEKKSIGRGKRRERKGELIKEQKCKRRKEDEKFQIVLII